MTAKARKVAAPMLYDGLPDAIKSIRRRKKLQQTEAARRGGLAPKEAGKWSDYETRKKRLGIHELPIICNGLGCTEFDLWEEKVELERQYYRKHARQVGESKPGYDTSIARHYVDGLYRLDADLLPRDEQDWFHELRNSVASSISNLFMTADRLKARYWEMLSKVRQDVD